MKVWCPACEQLAGDRTAQAQAAHRKQRAEVVRELLLEMLAREGCEFSGPVRPEHRQLSRWIDLVADVEDERARQ